MAKNKDKELEVTEQTSSASENDMRELHGELSAQLRKMLVGGQVVMSEDGLPVVLSPTPAVLNVVRQFLKDNNVHAKPTNTNDLGELVDSLPFEETEARPH